MRHNEWLNEGKVMCESTTTQRKRTNNKAQIHVEMRRMKISHQSAAAFNSQLHCKQAGILEDDI